MRVFGKSISLALASAAICLAASATPVLAQEGSVWRWVDANGTTHYSQSRPEGVEAERVSIREMSRSRGIDRPTPSEDEMAERQRQAESEREQADVQARQQELREEINEFCEQAAGALERLQGNPRILVTPPDGGDPYRMTEDERQAEIQRLQDEMEEHCD